MARDGFPNERDGLVPLARMTPALSALLLAAFALLVVWGLSLGFQHHGPNWQAGGADAKLYTALIRDVRGGASYYAVAPDELRRFGFPLRPVFTMRPPLLTLMLAELPDEGSRYMALAALGAAAWLAWAWRLWPVYRQEPLRCAWALALLSSGLGLILGQGAYLFHETWVGVLIALAIAIRGPRLWIVSVGLGLLAALMRELSFPFLGAMALLAWRDGRRGEAAAWVGAIGLAGAALAQHAAAVIAVTRATGASSSGWVAFSGYPFVLHLAQLNITLREAPLWCAALVLPPALLGLLFWPGGGGGRGARTAFVILGYALGFCVIGRPNNDYWGLIIAPLWPLGLAEVDRTMTGLVARVRSLVPGRGIARREAA